MGKNFRDGLPFKVGRKIAIGYALLTFSLFVFFGFKVLTTIVNLQENRKTTMLLYQLQAKTFEINKAELDCIINQKDKDFQKWHGLYNEISLLLEEAKSILISQKQQGALANYDRTLSKYNKVFGKIHSLLKREDRPVKISKDEPITYEVDRTLIKKSSIFSSKMIRTMADIIDNENQHIEEKFKSSASLTNTGLLFLSVILITAALLSTVFLSSRAIAQPIKMITEYAKETTQLNLDRKLPTILLQQKDELGELAQSIQAMGTNLQQAYKDLEQQSSQLEVLKNKLVRANTELKDFTYLASHELQAPLRGISSITSWLSEDYSELFDQKGREYLEKLLIRTSRMYDLIEGILQYSRIGRIIEKPRLINCDLYVQKVIDEFSQPSSIQVDIEGSLPTIKYEGIRLMLVIENLISNAINHLGTPEGKIVISCEERSSDWEFCVRDNGKGIEKKHFDRIFEIFYRLNAPTEGGSIGIGLTLVKKIVEQNGGIVRVESTVNEGSSFFFTILKS